MAGVATGGAAKASSAGSVGKLTSMVKRIDWADNRGMVLNPFAKGALKRAPDGGGAAPKIVRIDSVKYPEAAKHLKEAGALDRPLTVDRAGAAARRKEALKGTATKPGLDRDEAPPAVFKEGSQSVRHIDSSDNRGAEGSIGQQLRNVKNGTQVILKTGRKK